MRKKRPTLVFKNDAIFLPKTVSNKLLKAHEYCKISDGKRVTVYTIVSPSTWIIVVEAKKSAEMVTSRPPSINTPGVQNLIWWEKWLTAFDGRHGGLFQFIEGSIVVSLGIGRRPKHQQTYLKRKKKRIRSKRVVLVTLEFTLNFAWDFLPQDYSLFY